MHAYIVRMRKKSLRKGLHPYFFHAYASVSTYTDRRSHINLKYWEGVFYVYAYAHGYAYASAIAYKRTLSFVLT